MDVRMIVTKLTAVCVLTGFALPVSTAQTVSNKPQISNQLFSGFENLYTDGCGEILLAILLNNSEFQKEIGLLDYQKSELKAFASDLKAARESLFDEQTQVMVDRQQKGRDGLTYYELRHELNSRVENWPIQSSNKIFERVGEILLPDQAEELNQASFWLFLDITDNGFAKFIHEEVTKEKLELSHSEVNEFRSAYKALNAEFQREAKELQKKYREKLIDSLPKDKRTLFYDIFGKPRIGKLRIAL